MDKKGTLLIADDEPVLLEQLVEILSELGYPIVTAKDGNEMLEQVTQNPNIVAILSDIKMPGLTGIEALRALREKQIDVPIVFLTGFAEKNLVVEALRLGALDFLDKPFEFQILKKVMSQAIEIGTDLKSVDIQIAAMAKKMQISEADMSKFNLIQKSLFVMKIKNNAYMKRKVS
ncbi:MAG: response regulator [Bdellovibrionota bacterium]